MEKIKIYLSSLALFIMISIPSFGIKHIVTAAVTSFTPSSISNVSVGDTIRWEWESGTHTTTSTSVPSGANTWDNPLTSSETFFEYKVEIEGTYNYKCTPHVSFGMTGSFVVGTATSIANKFQSSITKIVIFPNPFNESISISLDNKITENIAIEIWSLNGEKIFDDLRDYSISSDEIYLDLSHLTSGIYFIKLLINNESYIVEKLIKY